MRCGKISVEGEAEEITAVKSSSQRHHRNGGNKSNPYSGMGLHKFSLLTAELSAKRNQIASKTGAPEALVRFAYRRNRWIPLVLKDGAPQVSIPPPIGTNTASNVKKGLARIESKDSQSKRPIRLGSPPYLTRKKRAVDGNVGAALIMIVLFLLVFYGRLCAICFTSAVCYLIPMLRYDDGNSRNGKSSNKRRVMFTIDVRSKEYKKKVIMDGLLERSHNRSKT